MRWQIVRFFSNSRLTSFSSNKSSSAKVQRLSHVFIRGIHNCKDASGEFTELDGSSIANVTNHWRQRFESEGIAEPMLSIEHIVAHVLGITKLAKLRDLKDEKFTKEQLEKLDVLCSCRLSRMPVQYIIGEWDFRDLTLKLEPPIFIPRPETEVLAGHLLEKLNDVKTEDCNVLEIGCGSGAISLSLLHSNKKVKVAAIDVNPHACELTMRNARNLKLDDRLNLSNAKLTTDGTIEVFKEYSSSNESVNFNDDKFDFIVSNPPYIPTKKIFKLQPEITLYEDITALDGGDDGLQVIKSIVKYASRSLRKGGFLFLEVDSSHPNKVTTLIEENYETNGLKVEGIHKDFSNNERFIEIVKVD